MKTAAVTYLVRGSAAGLGFLSGVMIVLTPSAARGAPLWPVWASLAVALTSVAGRSSVTGSPAGPTWPPFRGWALMSVALLGAVPAVAVMYGIRHVAGGEPAAGTRGEQAGALMALQQSLPAGSAHRAEDRSKLGQLLGADRSVVADLQAGLAILGPLIASAAAAFLPH